jgi:hypothetical protein
MGPLAGEKAALLVPRSRLHVRDENLNTDK